MITRFLFRPRKRSLLVMRPKRTRFPLLRRGVCSRRVSWDNYTNLEEIPKSTPASETPISLQQVAKSGHVSPRSPMAIFISAIPKLFSLILDTQPTTAANATCGMTIRTPKRKKPGILRAFLRSSVGLASNLGKSHIRATTSRNSTSSQLN